MNIALLTAGGTGTRMHQDIPEQFLHVRNKPKFILWRLSNGILV